jgi:poly-beta-1,6-N-acetyl-D-glucosamine synthase
MTTAFWIAIALVFYTFIGYGILLYVIVKIRQLIVGRRVVPQNKGDWPTLTLVVAAYNEQTLIEQKIENTLSLAYPAIKIKYLFVTDGSTDQTPELIAKHSAITLLHKPERTGKIAAIHRAMHEVKSDIVVFTDANTFLNKDALQLIARHYADKKVGAVSGEKRVSIEDVADATAGEGFYWKYESKLKTWDSELNSVVGAAGELFSIRSALYEPVEPDTILDDFMISMRIAQKGYRIVYEPKAYATETGSENIKEELKRKIRIAAGGIQSIVRLRALLNPFRNFVLFFQYVSHRVLRWTITPFLMLASLVLNALIICRQPEFLYALLFIAQLGFYSMALVGWVLEKRNVRVKILFIPYYFCMMNYAVLAGINRYFRKSQSAVWDKAKRR